MSRKKDRYIRKPIVFNSESAWHMEILNRINKESGNFSSYVISILKGHFDVKPEIKEIPEKKAISQKEKTEPSQKKVRNEVKNQKVNNKPQFPAPQVFINKQK